MNQGDDKIALILSASQKRFGRYGLSKTTMNEIAADVNMSKASLYYYFKDKESIFLAVNAKEQNDFTEKIRQVIQAERTAKKMLFDYTVYRLKLLQKQLSLAKLNNENYHEVKPLIHSLINTFKKTEVSIITDILKKGVERKEFKIRDVNSYAELFIDIQRGLRQHRFSGYIDKGIYVIPARVYHKLKEQSELFTAIFLKGLCNN
ncbi:MAG: TetR/AcrR family transcriptional regulator [Bacteroidia bacterium]|jgi:TetR/AcrR family transcriptional repressor of mexJK operon|nr:TetR/AcrR family transcriptional regulator [Bacteroidia bacterium]